MKRLYAVRDRVAGMCIGGVYVHRNDTAAIRMFSDIASDKQSMIAQHPHDFELLYVAKFDDDSGLCIAEERPLLVMSGESWVAAQTPDVSAPEKL